MYIIVFNSDETWRSIDFYDYLCEKVNGYGLGVAKCNDNTFLVPSDEDITIDYLEKITDEYISGYTDGYKPECAFVSEITRNTRCIGGGQKFAKWLEKNN